jgi:hemerythrin-like domain-containing protein
MLTATYSLVALSAEQKNARSILCKLQMHIQNILHDLQSINQTCVENALIKLEQLEQYCQTRKFEMYVIPAIRRTTREADPILAELDSLSLRGMLLLRDTHARLNQAFNQGLSEVKKVCTAMDLYCRNLLKRFAKEEEELLPIIRGLLPVDEWFNIAAKFLSDDAKSKHPQVVNSKAYPVLTT